MHRLLTLLAFLATVTWADSIYKSVDDAGNIIYSEEPSGGGEPTKVLNIPPGPSEKEVEAARERDRKLQQFLEETDATGTRTDGQRSATSEAVTESDGVAAGTDWRARRDEERRRAAWGKDWPIHHPRHK